MFGLSLYDTTLRDGAQCEDLQLTTPDKIKIALKLDEFRYKPAQAEGLLLIAQSIGPLEQQGSV